MIGGPPDGATDHRDEEEDTPDEPARGRGGVQLPVLIGGIALVFAGVCVGMVGKRKYDEYGTATVTVRVQRVVDRVSDVTFAKYTWYRNDFSATYRVGAKTYPYPLGSNRFQDGEQFTTCYLKKDPATPGQSRPLDLLVIGPLVSVLGLGLVVFALRSYLSSRSPRPVSRAAEHPE